MIIKKIFFVLVLAFASLFADNFDEIINENLILKEEKRILQENILNLNNKNKELFLKQKALEEEILNSRDANWDNLMKQISTFQNEPVLNKDENKDNLRITNLEKTIKNLQEKNKIYENNSTSKKSLEALILLIK